MHQKFKSNKMFIYVVFVFLIILSTLNIGSYAFLKNYLLDKNDLIKQQIIINLGLDPSKNYVLKANPQINWGVIFINIHWDNVEFYDQQKKNIYFFAQKIHTSFLVYKLLDKKIFPYDIQSENLKINLNPQIFKNNHYRDDVLNENSNDFARVIKKFLQIKNFNIENARFSLIGSEQFEHFIEKINFQTKNKNLICKILYQNNLNIDNLQANFNVGFNLTEKIIKISKIKLNLRAHDIWRFAGIQNIETYLSGRINILMGKRFSISKINAFLDSFDHVVQSKLDEKKFFISLTDFDDKKIKKLNILYDNALKKVSIHDLFLKVNQHFIRTNFELDFKNINQQILSQDIIADSSFDVRDFLVFWPEKFFSDTKNWYQSAMQDGLMKDLRLNLKLIFDDWNFVQEKTKINGRANIEKINLKCCGNSFPMINNIEGKLKFDMRNMQIDFESAFIEVEDKNNQKQKICANRSKLNLDFDSAELSINGILKSDLKNLLNFYDKDFELKILDENILEDITGKAIVNFALDINLNEKNSDDNQLIIKKNINVFSQDVYAKIYNNGDVIYIQPENFDLHVDNFIDLDHHDLIIQADGLINGKKFYLVTTKDSDNKDKIFTNLKTSFNYGDVKNILDPIFGSLARIEKMIFVDVGIISDLQNKSESFDIELDLSQATIVADYLKMNNKIGDQAWAKFTMIHDKDNNYYLNNFLMKTPSHNLYMKKLEYLTSQKYLSLNCLQINNSFVNFLEFYTKDNKNYMYILADQIYYHNFDWLGFEGDEKNKENYISGNINQLILYENLYLKDLILNIECDTENCHTISLQNLNSKQKTAHLNAVLQNNVLDIYSDNAGLVLRGMNFVKYIFGGELKLHGYLNKYDKNEFILENNLLIKNCYLSKAPAVAHLLSLASITGAFTDLIGPGIPLKKIDSNFIYYNNKLKFGKSIADGLSIGFSFEGNVDIGEDIFEIDGSIMPFNFINLILRKIPLLGEFLVGKPGNGLFSIDFEASGKFDNPRYKVNPLKIFIPYTIKRIFTKSKDI